ERADARRSGTPMVGILGVVREVAKLLLRRHEHVRVLAEIAMERRRARLRISDHEKCGDRPSVPRCHRSSSSACRACARRGRKQTGCQRDPTLDPKAPEPAQGWTPKRRCSRIFLTRFRNAPEYAPSTAR